MKGNKARWYVPLFLLLIAVLGIVSFLLTRQPAEIVPVTIDKKPLSESGKEAGKSVKPLFTEVKEEDIKDEALKNTIKDKKKQIGIHREGDLYIIVPESGKERLRLIDEVKQEQSLQVYFKKVKSSEEGKDYFIGKSEKDMEIWFFDVDTKEPIQLEELEREISRGNNEIAEATTVERNN